MIPQSRTSRRLVPRWRSLDATLQSGELSTPRLPAVEPHAASMSSVDLLSRLERWHLRPSLITAAELIETCIVEGREHDAVSAARRILTVDKNAAPLIRAQAATLLVRTGHSDEVSPIAVSPVHPFQNPRLLTRIHPHDPLAWVELALNQLVRGNSLRAAERSMLVALDLAPNNRHVLRSAARLFLHLDDAERALALIARNPATKSDPWLMSSEIALAQVADRPSRFLKRGDRLLTAGGLHPHFLTELAGAVGTEDLVHGNRKKTRKRFVQSLIDPTGSSLAQGEWANASLGGDLVSEARLNSTFENAEALAFHLIRTRRLGEVKEACERWAGNDPFSVRPFEFGASAAGMNEDFEVALAFAERGLQMRPTNVFLLNSLAFASASLDRIDEAVAALAKLKNANLDRPQKLVSVANKGLVAFRAGDVGLGRKFYAEAIEGFRRDGASEYAARAKLYLAREAIRADTEDWRALLKEAQSAMAKVKDTAALQSLRLIEKMAAEQVPPQSTGPAKTRGLNVRDGLHVHFDFGNSLMKDYPSD